ncbi:hypothetical protein [Methyloceanibacter methanicus]|nr:hypothetical protein [Methyloceanibacter methanicus]
MSVPIDHTRLHRTAKYFMDNGQAETVDEAMDLLHGFGLTVHVGPELAESTPHQIALLTLINLARRTFLGGVEVVGMRNMPLLLPLTADADLAAAVESWGPSCRTGPDNDAGRSHRNMCDRRDDAAVLATDVARMARWRRSRSRRKTPCRRYRQSAYGGGCGGCMRG